MTQEQGPPKELVEVAKYLANFKQSGLRLREAVLDGKRIHYFKGKSAINALLRPQYNSPTRPPVQDQDDALMLLNTMNRVHFFLLVERSEAPSSGGPRTLEIVRNQSVFPEGYYAFFYQGSQLSTTLGGILLIGLVFAGVMFPLWPNFMREGAWYLSVAVLGFLGLLFIIAIIRLIFYLITIVVARPGIWIFPNLFEDVGFFESFVPLWAWDDTAERKKAKQLRDEQRAANRAGGGGKREDDDGFEESTALDSDRKDD